MPLSCCDEAATYLIHALGGEDAVRELVDGVKWWQVRGVAGLVVVVFYFHVMGTFVLWQHRWTMDDDEERPAGSKGETESNGR